MSSTDKIPIYLLWAARPAASPHERDTINGCVYRFLAVRDGVPEYASDVMYRYFKGHGAPDPERVRWSWGNNGLVSRTAQDASDFAAQVLADSPFTFMGFIK